VGLGRELGLFDATMLGLGSIIGTGVFVSIGIGAGVAGSGVILAIVVAALVAACNALNSAQLAANHPVSGGTYEYGYRWLHPTLGFSAGWMFLCAKSASAATAALGFAGYLLNFTGQDARWLVPVAVLTVVVVTAVVLTGVRLSSWLNIGIVSVTLIALVSFVLAGAPAVRRENLTLTVEPLSFLQACALMFVAYTGYGRIATLGEEVIEPRRTIPRAIIITLIVSAALYRRRNCCGRRRGPSGAESGNQGKCSATREHCAEFLAASRRLGCGRRHDGDARRALEPGAGAFANAAGDGASGGCADRCSQLIAGDPHCWVGDCGPGVDWQRARNLVLQRFHGAGLLLGDQPGCAAIEPWRAVVFACMGVGRAGQLSCTGLLDRATSLADRRWSAARGAWTALVPQFSATEKPVNVAAMIADMAVGGSVGPIEAEERSGRRVQLRLPALELIVATKNAHERLACDDHLSVVRHRS
jgi:hypothetical protein